MSAESMNIKTHEENIAFTLILSKNDSIHDYKV